MILKNLIDQLNFAKQCRKYHLSFWQCPHFLTILIGIITIIAMFGTYIIGNRYTNQPELVALVILVVTLILIIIGYFIIHSFNSLAEANQMKSEFISIASHQLRTPLSIIKWTLHLILRKDTDKFNKKQLSHIKDIKKNNQRMIDLVNDLLNVSRIEQGRLSLQPKKIDLIEITEELLKEYQSLAKAKNINLITKLNKNAAKAWGDPQRIKLVIQNLIDNAIRYSANKKNKITISITKIDSESVKWEIKDSGVGIPKNDQKKIFQKFSRSQNALRYQTEGTGLGLFIAKAIIKESNGTMGFKSKEGKGSTFWFELPIKKSGD